MNSAPKKKLPPQAFNSLAFDFSTTHALRKSMNRYRTLFESAGDPILVFDWQGRILDFNRIACRRLGYSRKTLGKKKRSDIERSDPTESGKKRLETLRKEGYVLYETIYLKRNGETLPVELNCRVIEYEYEPAILTIARDLSERIRAEKEKAKLQAQLRQSQKMEAIGALAGGIAHDFNNILTPIRGHAEIALLKLPPNHETRKNMEGIIQAAERARGLIQQVLSFSRQDSQQKKPLQVHTILKEGLRLLRASLPTTIEIRQNISKCGAVLANATQIHQIILNLCTNAKHAMRRTGGVLEVCLNEIVIKPGEPTPYPNMQPGSYVKLTVSDTGHGMPPDVQERIFEPHFTTKKEGEGTGMGLSVVHGIVKNHNGEIKVYSEPGKGTTFTIFLPRIHAHAKQASASVVDNIPKGSGNILLIDDEAKIVEVISQMLDYLGYRVTALTDSSAALKDFRRHPDRYDLVITDMTMPHMTGDVLARKLLAMRPDLPILLCTGYSRSISREKAQLMGIRDFIMKPPTISELARAIYRALQENPSGTDHEACSAPPGWQG